MYPEVLTRGQIYTTDSTKIFTDHQNFDKNERILGKI